MIENDMLIRETPIYDGQDCIACRKDCIITKEEFLECFNEWIRGKEEDIGKEETGNETN